MLECDVTPLRQQTHAAHVLRRQKIAIRGVYDFGINLRVRRNEVPMIKHPASLPSLNVPWGLYRDGNWALLEPLDIGLRIKNPSLRLEKLPPDILTRIKRIVAANYSITENDLICQRRTHDLILPRHVAMYLCKEITPRSFPEIGRVFSGRDHTTVLHACRSIDKKRSLDFKLSSDLADIKQTIQIEISEWRAAG